MKNKNLVYPRPLPVAYSVLLKMKELGFPQDGEGFSVWKKGKEEVFVPTIEDVLRELGDGFSALVKGGVAWTVHDEEGIVGWHKTPLRALCELWIQLNEK